VEVSKGDAGIDYIVRNDIATVQSDASVSSPVLYVTNFAGEANVFPANDGSAVSTLPQLLVRQGETVSVEFVSSLSYVERNAMQSATTDFWRTYEFAPAPISSTAAAEVPPAVTPPPVVAAEPTVSTNVQEIRYVLSDELQAEYDLLLKRKNNAFLATLIFFAGGLTLGGIGMYYQYAGNAFAGYFCTISGVLVAGVGVGTLIHGLSIKLE
jgi:hypothetical protein